MSAAASSSAAPRKGFHPRPAAAVGKPRRAGIGCTHSVKRIELQLNVTMASKAFRRAVLKENEKFHDDLLRRAVAHMGDRSKLDEHDVVAAARGMGIAVYGPSAVRVPRVRRSHATAEEEAAPAAAAAQPEDASADDLSASL